MKPRKNPTPEQLAKRMWRAYPDSGSIPCYKQHMPIPPRAKNDAYWALRCQGYPHSYAKRAYRDQLPQLRECKASEDPDDYVSDEVLVQPCDTWTEIVVAVRPELSEQSIRDLEPRIAEYVVWDVEVPGFGVRVRPSGYKAYVVFYRVRGRKVLRKFTIGNVAEFSLEQARDAARDYRYQARLGNDLSEEE